MSSIVDVTGRDYKVLADATSGIWHRLSFWTKASDVELDDGRTLEALVPNVFSGTLTKNTDTITFSSGKITTEATVEVFTTKYGLAPTDMEVGAGYVKLTFEPQEIDVGIKVRVSYIL